MAFKFNKLIAPLLDPPVKIQCIIPHQIMHFEGTNYFLEPYLEGTFVKHNDIFGNIYTNNLVAEAFSCFTYHKSGGKYIILDIQGVNYHWTDTAVCSLERKLGGITDTGFVGIQGFFKNYSHNPLIQALGLPEIREPVERPLKDNTKQHACTQTVLPPQLHPDSLALLNKALDPYGVELGPAQPAAELYGVIAHLVGCSGQISLITYKYETKLVPAGTAGAEAVAAVGDKEHAAAAATYAGSQEGDNTREKLDTVPSAGDGATLKEDNEQQGRQPPSTQTTKPETPSPTQRCTSATTPPPAETQTAETDNTSSAGGEQQAQGNSPECTAVGMSASGQTATD
eukprot:TRINITY_DN63157_c0_g1_i2.p2 TRINITY_DN63157_c0_g1~~TRINITY_DN63157_c0_g1_i2.p2  ORF type:complete len:341 (-),score=60.44 TRINITY_DN63157_c0_g1_i2:1353-2375(-)